MITEFKLHDSEVEMAKAFEKEHRHPDVNKGAIGGHISYEFTPTSVGTAVFIKCNICHTNKNITDYNLW